MSKQSIRCAGPQWQCRGLLLVQRHANSNGTEAPGPRARQVHVSGHAAAADQDYRAA